MVRGFWLLPSLQLMNWKLAFSGTASMTTVSLAEACTEPPSTTVPFFLMVTQIEDFVRWTEQYNLWCKMLYFGQQLEKELREEVEIQRQSGPRNLLELLPDEFTKEQHRLVRQQQGKAGGGDGTLRKWHTRGYVAYDEVSDRYVKTESYKQKRGTLTGQ